ncbi:sugar phosphate isomerase/epimerase family protein [Avibacterium sp. 21-599]|uniref:sugar phosphate isomerase/epimerase family protein n=1 Tax=Avibacterium sp. 21-599 TaxID=2911528 RepID=UPI002247E3D8|nr:sugar phosphate isomerase/epimerase [Avibacterium sp. 21-599]MCW9717172.1 sugar phosphate isomerase/epimerase [Avibacterium sp. 21-599]
MNNNFRLAVNTSIYDGYNIEDIFSSIRKCGFKYFELAYNQGYMSNINQELFNIDNANKINMLKNKYDLDTFSLGCTMDLSTDNLYEIFYPRLKFAHSIGVKYINACTTTSKNKQKLIYNLKSLKPLLEDNNCILCLENAGDYNFNAFVELSDAFEILNELDDKYYSINFDPGNMFTYDRKLNVIEQSLKAIKHSCHFHIKDVYIERDVFKFSAIGEGMIAYQEIIKKLSKNNILSSLEIPLRMYRKLDSTPKKTLEKIDLNLIELTLIKSKNYIEKII